MSAVTLQGRLGRDPWFRSGDDEPRARFPLAVVGEDGRTVWHTVVVSDQAAEALHEQYQRGDVRKDRLVDVTGQPVTRIVKWHPQGARSSRDQWDTVTAMRSACAAEGFDAACARSPRPRLSRREALVGTAASLLGLAGCMATPRASSTGSGTAAPGASPLGSATPAETASPSASASPQGQPLPSRSEVVARYGTAKPTFWGLTTPGVLLSLGTMRPVVALTFDACGGPTPTSAGCGYDQDLIDLLRHYQAKATLFLNARWIAAHPSVARELVADPLFEIGNHGTRHVPLSVTGRSAYGEHGTANAGAVYDEIMGNQGALTTLIGHAPRYFRPGTACCDEVAVHIAADLGCRIAGFSVNGDAGTTFTRAQVVGALSAVKAGDIVISHMNRPEHQTAEGYRNALPRLLDRGLRTVTLSEIAP